MQNTQYFNLERPERGSYFGSWHTPVNANMDLIDKALHQINSNNAGVAQELITGAGTTWWDIAAKLFYIHNGTQLVRLVTENEFVLSLGQQNELKAGVVGTLPSSLHWHKGWVDKYYIVKDPTLASGADLPMKDYYAIPWKLFNDTVGNITSVNTNTIADVAALKVKVNGLSTNGIDITIGAATASGDITAKSVSVKAGNSGGTIKVGGGISTVENEIVVSKNLPVNIKTSSASATGFELQVQGDKVWTAGNMGAGSGLIADKVDGCDVNDTLLTNTNLWTAAKIADAIANGVGSVDVPDTSGFATNQQLQDHKTSGDHDTRYLKKTDYAPTPAGTVQAFYPPFYATVNSLADGMSHFDGTGIGQTGTQLDGWRICNGSGGTPDLRGRFILGTNPSNLQGTDIDPRVYIANATDAPGKVGGEDKHKLTTAEIEAHDHPYTDAYFSANNSGANWGTDGGVDTNNNLFEISRTTGKTGGNGTDGKAVPHNTVPPFYTLVYIIKYK